MKFGKSMGLAKLGLSLMFGVLVACTPKMNGLFQDPTFTYETLFHGGMAVAGVAIPGGEKDQGVLSAETQDAELFREAILNNRPGISVMPPGDIAQVLGSDYGPTLTYYFSHDVPPPGVLAKIRSNVTGVRYVAFVAIPSNQVGQGQFHGDDRLDYTTTRTIMVSVKMYDLMTERLVWSGSLTEARNNTNSYETGLPTQPEDPNDKKAHQHRRDDEIAQAITSVVDLAVINKTASYPSAPASYDLISQIFDHVAKNLPEPKKKK